MWMICAQLFNAVASRNNPPHSPQFVFSFRDSPTRGSRTMFLHYFNMSLKCMFFKNILPQTYLFHNFGLDVHRKAKHTIKQQLYQGLLPFLQYIHLNTQEWNRILQFQKVCELTDIIKVRNAISQNM